MELVFQYRAGNSFIHRLDPVTKTVALFAVSFLAFGSFVTWPQLLILAFAFFAAVVLGGLSPGEIWKATKWLAIACLFFFLIQAYMLKVPGQVPVLRLGQKVIYLETLDYSASVSVRIYTIFLVSLIFIRTTHPRDLAVGFVQILNLPYKVPYAFFIALRIIPLIEEEARCINEAHKVRGYGEKTGLGDRLQNIKRFTVPLLVRSLRDASITSHSMESRGFGAYPRRNYVEEVRMSTAGKVITASCIIAVIVWYALIFLGVIPFRYSVA